MNIVVAVWVFSVLFVVNCGSTKGTKRLHGEYNYTASLGDDIVQLNETGPNLKPCYKHLERIKRFETRPKTFVPLCGIDGYYAPIQCHSSTGYCWCVDKFGKEKVGTRIKGLTYCGLQSVRRPCERHRSLTDGLAATRRSFFIPRCNEKGYYSPLQCLTRNKKCWCVDKNGKEKKGTRKQGITNCEDKDSTVTEVVDWFSVPHHKLSEHYPCLRHKRRRQKLIRMVRHKFYDPTCDTEGRYEKKQCYYGYCWCTRRNGKIIEGTKKKGDVDCEPKSSSGPTRKVCPIKRLEALKLSLSIKPFIPLCQPHGEYSPLQCDVYKGNCWCVDEDGKEIAGSRTKRTPNCFSKVISKAGKRPCYLHRWYIKKLPFTNQTHQPVCRENGFFKPKQCSYNKDYCWCVKHDGTEIKGSLTFGKPRCSAKSLNLTDVFSANNPSRTAPCIRHRARKNNMISVLSNRKPFNPICDEDGNYDVKQCYNGYCWCVEKNGNMITGTKKKGVIVCDVSALTRKHCPTERLKAQETSFLQKPFVPLCQPDGNYSPLQCDVYKGECWCADEEGEEIAGSRTKRTPNCFFNDFNKVDQDGPCLVLKSHFEKLSFTKMVHEPKCESNGFFQPAQCSNSKDYCWCVMHDGTEIEGSITFGKPHCHEKPAPAVPKVRGPCEDHLYHANNLIFDRDVYTPICDNKGFYVPLQCNNHTGYCWCVDRYGVVGRGTRTQGVPVCGEEARRPCYVFQKRINKEYTPVCTEEGYFAPLQCNVNRGICWCADKMGVSEPGTSIYQKPYCGTEKRHCELHRRLILSTNQTEGFVPSCDLHGYYSSIQCSTLSDECWCSDRDGIKISETTTKGIPECDQIPRPCDEHASRTSNYDYIFGVYIPQCDSDGYYKDTQCHAKTNTCWCSSKIGVQVPGTMATGRPNCFEKRISR